jgi:hypothetical protein
MIPLLRNDGTLYQDDLKTTNELIEEANLNEQYGQVVIPVVIDARADTTFAKEFVAPFKMVVTNVEAKCTVANTGGTLTLRRATTLISGAATCAVDATVTATTVVTAQHTIAKGETLNVIAAGTDATLTRGILSIKGYRVA